MLLKISAVFDTTATNKEKAKVKYDSCLINVAFR